MLELDLIGVSDVPVNPKRAYVLGRTPAGIPQLGGFAATVQRSRERRQFPGPATSSRRFL